MPIETKQKCMINYLKQTNVNNFISFCCSICSENKFKYKIVTVSIDYILQFQLLLHYSNLSDYILFDQNHFLFDFPFNKLNNLVTV